VHAAQQGNYTVLVTNSAGSVTSTPAARTVVDTTPPVITLAGANPLTNQYHSVFVDPGATVSDACAGSLSVTTNSSVNPNTLGVYTVQYAASDPSGNSATSTRTVYVADTTALPGDCIIEDPQLEQAIRCTLTNFNRPLSADDWSKLTCLWACKRQITNLMGLECATNLVSLHLDDNAISDLTPLQSLTHLSSLELYNNRLGNLLPLAGLTNLTCLVLGGYPVTDYTPLSGLTSLVSLSVRSGTMGDLTCLQNLTRLASLRLWENGITNALPLAGLTNLSCLDLRWNSVTNFAPSLTGLTSLTSLYLGGNSLTNVPPLQALQQLTLLNLDDNRITDLSPLTNLTRLNYLAVSRNTNATFSALSNLPGLVNLELRGNFISNVAFLSGLSHLTYADLAYNSITDIGPLTSLTGLNSLVLAGNPLANFSSVGSIPNLTNVWLFDNAITNANFVASLPRLNHLNLDQNQIADVGPLVGLKNLTGLGLSRNPIANYAMLSGFINLTSLRLEANCLGDADLPSFLPRLSKMAFLSLNHNRISSLVPLIGLTNCQELYVQENRLHDIQPVLSLPLLADVNLSLNALDLSSGSSAMSVIQDLQCMRAGTPRCPCGLATDGSQGLPCQGINVTFSPQDEPPAIFPKLPWGFPPLSSYAIPCNATSSIPVSIFDAAAPDGLPPCDPMVNIVNSSDAGGVSIVDNELPGTNGDYLITMNAGNATGNPILMTVVATDEAGLSSSNSFSVIVVSPVGLSNLCLNVDSNLVAAISSAAAKASTDLTTVDLLRLTYLGVNNADVSGFCGWPWLTNLTTLFLSGGSITNLTFLTNLPALSSLTFNNTGVTDFSPLEGLSNLVNLELYGDSINDLSFLTNVSRLGSLTLYKTRVSDLSPLTGLTNLQSLYLRQNRIADMLSLTNLPGLSVVDLALNSLDLTPGSATMAAIEALVNRDVTVSYLPQRQPPAITMNTNWVIAANTPSWLYFLISDNAESSDLLVTASALNANLMPNTNLVVGNASTYFGLDWFLDVTPASNQFGTTTITLTAVNDAGLTGTTSIVVTVQAPLPLDGPVFPDTKLTSWVTAGEGLWFGQTNVSYASVPAAQSGSITNNEASGLQVAVNGPGLLTFWWKVSSETNYDFLTFYIDTNKQTQISGEVDWREQVYGLSPGLHTLMWKYCKDQNTSQGVDAGWVAQVSFVPASWLQVAGILSNSQVQLDMYLEPAKLYEVLASPDLVSWSRLGVVAGNSALVSFTDTNATARVRFYRLHELPPPPWLELVGAPTRGQCELRLYIEPGKLYEVLASTNLMNWVRLAVVAGTNNTMLFTDTNATIGSRFYRLHQLPPPPWLELVGGPTNGHRELMLYLEPGKLYDVLASTNSVNWFRLATVTGISGGQPFVDTTADSSLRSYHLQELAASTIWIEQVSLAANGSVQLILHSQTMTSFEIQTSTNLSSWSALTTITNTLGAVSYADVLATNSAARFYRAVLR
jgi:internalin A